MCYRYRSESLYRLHVLLSAVIVTTNVQSRPFQRQSGFSAENTTKETVLLWLSSGVYCCQGALRYCHTWNQQGRDDKPVLVQCWASVVDAGTTLYQHWINVSCVLGTKRKDG